MRLTELQSLTEASKGESTVDFSDHIEELRDGGVDEQMLEHVKSGGIKLLKSGFSFNKKREEFSNDVFRINAPRADFFRSDYVKGAGFYFVDEAIRIAFIIPTWLDVVNMDIGEVMKLHKDFMDVAARRSSMSAAAAAGWSAYK